MRMGLVSSGAVRRVRGSVSDTSAGPVGAVSSDHIDAQEQQRAGAGFGNAEGDYGAADAGEIDARANARQYGPRMKGKKRQSSWRPEWFGGGAMGKLGDRSRDPDSDVGGPGGVTGQSALDRARRGET